MRVVNAEEKRILWAAREGRMHTNRSGRYVIDGEPRPDRKTRERLVRRGWIAWTRGEQYDAFDLGGEVRITDLGYAALAEPSA